MKLSCLPVSLYKYILSGDISLNDWASLARKVGLNGVDISLLLVPDHTPKTVSRIRGAFEHEGMPLIMVTTYPDFTNPNRIQREREFAYLQRDIALSSALGACYLRILAGQAYPETGREEGINLVVEYFKRAADIAERYDIKLLFENHSKPGVWEYVDFSYPTDIFLEIFEKTNDTGIGINFDTCNTLSYGDEPIPVLKKVLKRVETIHVADIKEKGNFEPVLIGTGAVDLDEIFDLLIKERFDGWFCIEEASFNGIRSIGQATGFVRNKWAERTEYVRRNLNDR